VLTSQVTYTDQGAARIFDQLRRLAELVVVVGVVGPRGQAVHPESDLSVATIALFNEFGTSTAPERSFLRSAVTEGRDDIARTYQQQVTLVVAGRRDALQALDACGRQAALLVRRKLDRAPEWAVPLSLITIKRKGSTIPLRDTDTMRKAIGWSVREGDENGASLAGGYAV